MREYRRSQLQVTTTVVGIVDEMSSNRAGNRAIHSGFSALWPLGLQR